VAAIGLTQLLRGFLYRVSPVDPLAFVAGLVVVVTRSWSRRSGPRAVPRGWIRW